NYNGIVKIFEVDDFDCNKAQEELVDSIVEADNFNCNKVQ
ncbi:11119_t:CDS:1, partial [Racocetra persica]